MDRSAIFWFGRLLVAVAGAVLATGATRQLGQIRASAKWPSAPRSGTFARPLWYLGLVAGVGLVAAALALSAGVLAQTDSGTVTPVGWRGWLLAGGVAVAVVGMGGFLGGRMIDRAELTSLIRMPSGAVLTPMPSGALPITEPANPTLSGESSAGWTQTSLDVDPAVPSYGEPGWVYRDATGDWYLAVATRGGKRLVRLADFALTQVGAVDGPLQLAGSVQLTIWPP
jgi:hypothetical protein